ncbi:MAG TPA: amidohydrolase family protein [Myxococcota bacterium]|nr:amidohydrolase family protein [Myxococcota bacterium]
MSAVDFGVFDADNHYYEPRDAFRHLAPEMADRAVKVVTDASGKDTILVAGRKHHFTPPTFDLVPPPGHLKEMLKNHGEGTAASFLKPMRPEYQRRDARLAVMDEQGVESALLFPTFGVTFEHALRGDPEASFAALEAFNRWIEEDWGFGADGRIFGVPLLSLIDVDLAVKELERVLARGARMVHLNVGPVNGRSPGDPHFDALWSRLAEARVPVAYHASESGYNELYSTQWGHAPRPRSHHMSAWQNAFCFIETPLMHTLGALIFDNLFGRFPDLRVATIECGASWATYLLPRLDKAQMSCTKHAPWIGGRVKDRASDVFRSHVFVNPYPEEDHAKIFACLPLEKLLFGSDWPHPEGIAEPCAYPDYLPEGTSPTAIRRIMRDNARGLLGLD